MDECESKEDEAEKNVQLTPEEQYIMLKRCSDQKDITEWNKWREENPDEDIRLSKRKFKGFWLDGANFMRGNTSDERTSLNINYTGEVHLEKTDFENAHLDKAAFCYAQMEKTKFLSAHAKRADFHGTHLESASLDLADFEYCDFTHAILIKASLIRSSLKDAKMTNADLCSCIVRSAIVNGATCIWEPKFDRNTDFSGTVLDVVQTDSRTKQLLEYNIRRKNWEQWYKEHSKQKLIVRPFWWISDYGLSTGRIILTFIILSLIFAGIYYTAGLLSEQGIVSNLFLDEHSVPIASWLVPIRAVYFSVVTMTTLGFGDMYANAHSLFGHILLTIQVILGYVLLGALITRFAVLFTAGGPAGRFADEKTFCQRIKPAVAKLSSKTKKDSVGNKKDK